MSRSKRDRRGGRIAGELWGRGCVKIVGDRIVAVCGGERVGSPIRKAEAKELVATQRRRRDVTIVRAAMAEDA